MATRERIRVGRSVRYFPTDAECTTAGVSAGAVWPAVIVGSSPTTAALFVMRGNGVALPKLAVTRSEVKGGYSLHGVLPA